MCQHHLQPDHVLKDYLDDPVRFCEFSNYAYFHGQHVIHPNMIVSIDSDQSTYMWDLDHLVSLTRQNDRMKLVNLDGIYVHMGMEIQSYVNYTMVCRSMGYSYLSYERQLHKNMSKEEAENLIPVFIFVLYCGDGKWTGTQTLRESVKLPEKMEGVFQNYELTVVDIKDIDTHFIYDEDTKRFVETIQKVYQWDGEDLKALEGLKPLSFESAVAVATAIKRTDLIEYFYKDKEDKVDMCTSIARALNKSRYEGEQQGYSRGKSEGFQDGEQHGYHQAVIFMLEEKLGKLSEEVKAMVEKSSQELLKLLICQLSYMRNEEDIRNILMDKCLQV